MNARRLATAIILLGVPCVLAQNTTPKPKPIPVLDVIRKFNQPDPAKPAQPATADANPTTPAVPAVPADAHDSPPAPPGDQPAATSPESEPATAQPPPPATEPAHDADKPISPPPPPQSDTPPVPRQGLAIRVEKLQTGTGEVNPSQVKLVFPFPAKPLSQPPAGWCVKSSSSVPPLTREVELSPGNKITLTIQPDLLVPDADGASVFSVPEPGFDPSLGYRQNATVGTILTHAIRQLDQDSLELGTAIDKLQQILVSLPKPEPRALPVPDIQPDPKPEPKTKSSPDRKR